MWSEIEKELRKIGLTGITSLEHLMEFRKWENDNVELEHRIAAVLKNFQL